MNINFSQFLLQCAAMGVWVFIVAGLYAIWEKVADKYFPGFLDIEAAGASQCAPGTVAASVRRRREEGLSGARSGLSLRGAAIRPRPVHFPEPSRR